MRRSDAWLMRGLLVLSLFAVLCVAGCGRKSDLDPPSAAVAPPAPAQPADQRAWGQPPASPAPAQPPYKNRRFLLDPLLN